MLPFRQVMYAPYPTTHIDVDVNTVKQMPPCHEHIYNQRRYMRSELTAFWRANSDEEMSQDRIIHTDESFTPDLYVVFSHLTKLFDSGHECRVQSLLANKVHGAS